ncbi:MAG: DUF3160 domain-containing protein [Candidatus Parcubacteria bacterium]|nr:DUF3160 domain-containing protein [Candidatus Parcubacteria bacterium]
MFKKSAGVSNSTLIVLIFCAVILAAAVGYLVYNYVTNPPEVLENKNNQPIVNEDWDKPAPIVATVAAKRLIDPADIKTERIEVNAQIPQYKLPLAEKDINNAVNFAKKISLDSNAKNTLLQNGFVAIDTPKEITGNADDFADFYSTLKTKEIPLFVTTDSLLHYYHIFFDTTLMKLERDLFYDDIWQMSLDLYNDNLEIYNGSEGEIKEAAKQNVAYLAVALELLKPKVDQVFTDDTLRSEYCYEGADEEYCNMMLLGVKEQFGDKASYKYFSNDDLKKYEFTVPDFVKEQVASEVKLITAHAGWKESPIFVYKEDYSQYVPRGHYTKTEKLKNYFKAMIWYGRMTALIQGSPNLAPKTAKCTTEGIISVEDAKLQTLQAGLIAKKFLTSQEIQDKWQRMYAITSYMVGFADDLGPYEYGQALKKVFGQEISSAKLLEKYEEFKTALNEMTYGPKIYGGLGACKMIMPCPPLDDQELQALKKQAQELLASTKGFRLMGQRFTVDSYLFSEIVSPYTGKYTGPDTKLPTDKKPFTFAWNDEYAQDSRPFTWVKTNVEGCDEGREVRGFPTGLDIMAIFGSERALEIMKENGDASYSDYQSKFNKLSQEIKALPDDAWYQNLYYNWLYVLQSLLDKPTAGNQTFMQQPAWQDKNLNTALSSWTELRHDTILYVKQSYTIAEMGGAMELPAVGYVEPNPEFYNRLLNLTRLTKTGMEKLVPEEQLDKMSITVALERFDGILSKLLELSQKELANEKLTDDEYSFIESFGKTSKGLIDIVAGGDVDPEILKSTLVVDVHTDGNTEKVLEEATGWIKTLIVAYKLPDNRILLGAGPVFSYYEFKMPMAERLTDEKWKEMLKTGNYPSQPQWTSSFSK